MVFIKTVVGGQIVSGQGWSVGLNWSPQEVAGITAAMMTTLAGQVLTAFSAYAWNESGGTPLKGINAPTTTLTTCRTYLYPGLNDHATYVGEATIAPIAGVAEVGYAQIALVATTQTGLSGRAYRGRMYLPMTGGGNTTANLQLAPATATSVAQGIVNFINQVSTLVFNGGALIPVVVSATAGQSQITAVSVDTVPDTQRRRRDKIVGTRETVAVPVG